VRALLVSPGPFFSVQDVFEGWAEGLAANGVQVHTFNMHDRLQFYTQAEFKRRNDDGDEEYRRGFDEEGLTTSYAMLESLRYAREQGARVVSMSWGTYTRSAFLDAALTQAADAGMVLLAASGNDGKDTPMYPAAHPNVIAVGAAEADGTAWAQSNGCDHVQLIAYGTATLPVGHNGPPGNYAGTSIATPWVASAVSAWLQGNPRASASDAKTALLRSLQPGTNGKPGLFDQNARDRFLGSAKAQ
jgi:hypothetical protein